MSAKKIIFTSFAIIVLFVITNKVYSASLKRREEEKKLLAEQIMLRQMRKKYANIKNWNDFHVGIKYMEFPTKFGYDLTLLNKIENLHKLITFEELKLLYEMSKIDVNKMDSKQQDEFLKIMDKIY